MFVWVFIIKCNFNAVSVGNGRTCSHRTKYANSIAEIYILHKLHSWDIQHINTGNERIGIK